MAEWSTRELVAFGRMVGFPEQALTFLMKDNMDGNQFARLKSPSQLAVRQVNYLVLQRRSKSALRKRFIPDGRTRCP